MNRRLATLITLSIAVAIVLTSTTLFAADWGTIKGRFIVDGEAPEPKPLVVSKDQFCIDKNLMNESVLVGEQGGVANVLVYLKVGRREKVDAHPDYKSQLKEAVVLDNHGCHFVPRVATLLTGQELILKNSDPVGHNTNVDRVFNQIIPAGGETPTKVARASAVPLSVMCNIHPFMKGYLFVQDHPYMSVSGEDGSFEIKNVPAGKREFVFWHEVPTFLKDLKVGKDKTDRRGKVDVTLKAGETLDLGDIKVPAELLK